MEFKDNRSKEKRSKMKPSRRGAPKPQRVPQTGNNTSSSSQMEAMRGVIDLADSSDDRYSMRSSNQWRSQTPPRDLHELDLNEKQLEEHPQLSAGDYDIMSQMPTSLGGHFQFSSEKNWDTDDLLLLNTEASEYFTLNLKLLNAGLQTIPFYKRMDYASSMFTRKQLVRMDEAADRAEKQYQHVLKEHQNNPKIKLNSAKRTTSAKSQQSSTAKVENKEEKDDELDELLSMTADGGTKVADAGGEQQPVTETGAAETSASPPDAAAETAVAGNKEDIQQWLDNVLEE